MRTCLRSAAIAVAAASLSAALASCGETGGGEPGRDAPGRDRIKIGLLLPNTNNARYERFDRPLIEKNIDELCGDCTVEYANAQNDVATQKQQIDSMITKGVNVLILSAVDSRSARPWVQEAHDADIPVVAYDRLAQGPISAYVSFEGEQVGRIQGHALLKALGDKAGDSQIVMMNGDPITPGAVSIKDGALSVLKGKVKIGKAYDTVGWRSENVHANMSAAIAFLGPDNIDAVYAANDGLASGVIAALKAAHIEPLPPVTGQGADLAAVRRIISGEQYMSVYKPYNPEAEAAAELAVTLGRGENLRNVTKDTIGNSTDRDIPAVLLTPVALTVANIKDTIVRDSVYTVDQICTSQLASACADAGLTPRG